MKIYGKTWMSLGLVLLSLIVFITALQWPFKTAMFPITIAIAVFVMASLDVLLDLFLKQSDTKEESTVDFKLTGAADANIDEATARKRVIRITLWTLFFFVLILLVGFPVAVPIFFVTFLKIYGRESWTMTIILSAAAWIFFHGFFVRFLHLPFAEGWLLQGFQLLK